MDFDWIQLLNLKQIFGPTEEEMVIYFDVNYFDSVNCLNADVGNILVRLVIIALL